ncbi:serine hydrolase [Rhodococcus phage Shagrat]|nr:serine hydrolase [Rhodococcus phage Shagrat]
MKYILTMLAILLATIGFTAVPANAETPVNQCVGTWSVVVGGLGNNDSNGFTNANQRVGYNSFDTRSGVNELNRLARDHRRACPGDHVKVVGHSGGAAVAHVWVSENGHTFGGNVNVVLLADPKRPAGPGGAGFAATDFPFNLIAPLAGADANYRGVPVLQVCNSTDHICNSQAGWDGYLFGGAHNDYNFDVNAYSNSANGTLWRNR